MRERTLQRRSRRFCSRWMRRRLELSSQPERVVSRIFCWKREGDSYHEIEDPVCACRQAIGRRPNLEWDNFRGVEPCEEVS